MKIRIRKGLNNILISLGVISLLRNSRKVMGQTFYQCMPCKAGYYSDGSGGGCKICPRGTYSAHSISEKCTTCPEGQYTDSEGSTSCKACPKGHYCTGGHKYECLEGYYQPNEGANTCGPCRDDNYLIFAGPGGEPRKLYVNHSYYGIALNCCNPLGSVGCIRDSSYDNWRCFKGEGSHNSGNYFARAGQTIVYRCKKDTGKTYYIDYNRNFLGWGDGG